MDSRAKIVFTLLTITIITAAALVFGCVASNKNNAPLSDDQKIKAENIALNDSFVKAKLSDVQFKYYGQQGWTFNPDDPRFFTIGNITTASFHEVSPGVDRVRELPSVELIMGHPELGDINMYIFVDLDKGQVAYIGFTSRNGPHATGYYYTPGSDGIVQHTEDTNWTFEYDNATVVDTGYYDGQELTDQEKSSLFDLARTNSSVANFLGGAAGYSLIYHVRSEDNAINSHHYIATYPELSIQTTLPDGTTGPKYLMLTLDGKKRHIISLEEGEVFFPPPDPITPSSMG